MIIEQIVMNSFLLFFAALICGYYLSLVVSHPKRKHRILPQLRFKNIEIMPNIRIHYRNKTYWFHHWLYLSFFVALSFLIYDSFMQGALIKGVALGGVFQGLRYPDRFKFRHPRFQ